MRCFTRRSGQMLRIGDDVILTVTSVRGGSVRLGFKVPRDMIVDREEIAEQKKRERVAGNLQYAAQNRMVAQTRIAAGKRASAKAPAKSAAKVTATSRAAKPARPAKPGLGRAKPAKRT